ncbi:sodium:solute symporter [Arenibacter palladensis]|uniref:sodium:solute symporter n=1 Tax=Arenibacter palladensis TaxID=237373 RepID=UPI002FD3A6B7
MDLPLIDIIVFTIYMVVVVGLGSWFVRKSKTSDSFMVAGSSLPGWAVGLSLLGTYLSSNTFIGVVGKAFGADWNFYVFSLTLPIAAWIGANYFVPFYRQGGHISAYEHMEERFGKWARTYSVVCYLLIQLSRMATILFGVGLALHALTDWNLVWIILVSGAVVTLYTLLGGIEAVIWTDVMQSVVLLFGALFLLFLILYDMPGGAWSAIETARVNGKFSLGSFDLSLSKSTFWVVFLFGLFMNVKAFGFDQGYVQRYLTAKSNKEARKAIWMGGLLYVPISLIFFFIGSVLFSYYDTQPELLADLKYQVAIQQMENNTFLAEGTLFHEEVNQTASKLTVVDIGDQALPHYMRHGLPVGLAGLIIAAITAAAMSSIDTGLNSSATIILLDVYKRYWRPKADDRESMRVLHSSTLIFGVLGTLAALAMIGVESLLSAWWLLTGVFAGAMLGLFLLGFIVRKADKPAAITSVIVGILLIIWMMFSKNMELIPAFLRNPFHANMTVVVSTLGMFLVGFLISRLRLGKGT